MNESRSILYDTAFCTDIWRKGRMIVAIKSYSESIARLTLLFKDRDGKGFNVYSPLDWSDEAEEVCRLLTGKYLHQPVSLSFSTRLLSYNPETDKIYRLKSRTIDVEDPEDNNPNVFSSHYFRDDRIDFELGDLEAIMVYPDRDNIRDCLYVYTNGYITVKKNKVMNMVTPFLYDGAWREYIDAQNGEFYHVGSTLSVDMVSQQI